MKDITKWSLIAFFACVGLAVLSNNNDAVPVRAVDAPQRVVINTPHYAATEEQYAISMRPITSGYSNAFSALTELTDAASDNTALLLDKAWRADVANATTQIKFTDKKVRALEAPPRLEGIHNSMVRASYHFDTACDLLLEGIDDLDVDKMIGATS